MTPGRRRLSPDGLDDLQAGVTRAINHRFGHYLFVSVDDRRRGAGPAAPARTRGEG